ncbi:hypothetical protein CF319_g4744 [Tilletia indica]|nr:hypothetical protein CF319_g4744 [Tilletia indica]
MEGRAQNSARNASNSSSELSELTVLSYGSASDEHDPIDMPPRSLPAILPTRPSNPAISTQPATEQARSIESVIFPWQIGRKDKIDPGGPSQQASSSSAVLTPSRPSTKTSPKKRSASTQSSPSEASPRKKLIIPEGAKAKAAKNSSRSTQSSDSSSGPVPNHGQSIAASASSSGSKAGKTPMSSTSGKRVAIAASSSGSRIADPSALAELDKLLATPSSSSGTRRADPSSFAELDKLFATPASSSGTKPGVKTKKARPNSASSSKTPTPFSIGSASTLATKKGGTSGKHRSTSGAATPTVPKVRVVVPKSAPTFVPEPTSSQGSSSVISTGLGSSQLATTTESNSTSISSSGPTLGQVSSSALEGSSRKKPVLPEGGKSSTSSHDRAGPSVSAGSTAATKKGETSGKHRSSTSAAATPTVPKVRIVVPKPAPVPAAASASTIVSQPTSSQGSSSVTSTSPPSSITSASSQEPWLGSSQLATTTEPSPNQASVPSSSSMPTSSQVSSSPLEGSPREKLINPEGAKIRVTNNSLSTLMSSGLRVGGFSRNGLSIAGSASGLGSGSGSRPAVTSDKAPTSSQGSSSVSSTSQPSSTQASSTASTSSGSRVGGVSRNGLNIAGLASGSGASAADSSSHSTSERSLAAPASGSGQNPSVTADKARPSSRPSSDASTGLSLGAGSTAANEKAGTSRTTSTSSTPKDTLPGRTKMSGFPPPPPDGPPAPPPSEMDLDREDNLRGQLLARKAPAPSSPRPSAPVPNLDRESELRSQLLSAKRRSSNAGSAAPGVLNLRDSEPALARAPTPITTHTSTLAPEPTSSQGSSSVFTAPHSEPSSTQTSSSSSQDSGPGSSQPVTATEPNSSQASTPSSISVPTLSQVSSSASTDSQLTLIGSQPAMERAPSSSQDHGKGKAPVRKAGASSSSSTSTPRKPEVVDLTFLDSATDDSDSDYPILIRENLVLSPKKKAKTAAAGRGEEEQGQKSGGGKRVVKKELGKSGAAQSGSSPRKGVVNSRPSGSAAAAAADKERPTSKHTNSPRKLVVLPRKSAPAAGEGDKERSMATTTTTTTSARKMTVLPRLSAPTAGDKELGKEKAASSTSSRKLIVLPRTAAPPPAAAAAAEAASSPFAAALPRSSTSSQAEAGPSRLGMGEQSDAVVVRKRGRPFKIKPKETTSASSNAPTLANANGLVSSTAPATSTSSSPLIIRIPISRHRIRPRRNSSSSDSSSSLTSLASDGTAVEDRPPPMFEQQVQPQLPVARVKTESSAGSSVVPAANALSSRAPVEFQRQTGVAEGNDDAASFWNLRADHGDRDEDGEEQAMVQAAAGGRPAGDLGTVTTTSAPVGQLGSLRVEEDERMFKSLSISRAKVVPPPPATPTAGRERNGPAARNGGGTRRARVARRSVSLIREDEGEVGSEGSGRAKVENDVHPQAESQLRAEPEARSQSQSSLPSVKNEVASGSRSSQVPIRRRQRRRRIDTIAEQDEDDEEVDGGVGQFDTSGMWGADEEEQQQPATPVASSISTRPFRRTKSDPRPTRWRPRLRDEDESWDSSGTSSAPFGSTSSTSAGTAVTAAAGSSRRRRASSSSPVKRVRKREIDDILMDSSDEDFQPDAAGEEEESSRGIGRVRARAPRVRARGGRSRRGKSGTASRGGSSSRSSFVTFGSTLVGASTTSAQTLSTSDSDDGMFDEDEEAALKKGQWTSASGVVGPVKTNFPVREMYEGVDGSYHTALKDDGKSVIPLSEIFQPGDIVYAKMRGWRSWPAIIVTKDEVPYAVQDSMPVDPINEVIFCFVPEILYWKGNAEILTPLPREGLLADLRRLTEASPRRIDENLLDGLRIALSPPALKIWRKKVAKSTRRSNQLYGPPRKWWTRRDYLIEQREREFGSDGTNSVGRWEKPGPGHDSALIVSHIPTGLDEITNDLDPRLLFDPALFQFEKSAHTVEITLPRRSREVVGRFERGTVGLGGMPGRDLSGDEGGGIGELSPPPPLLGRNPVSQRRLDKRRAVSVRPDGLGTLGGGGMVAASDDREAPEFDPLFDSYDDFAGVLAGGKDPWMGRGITPSISDWGPTGSTRGATPSLPSRRGQGPSGLHQTSSSAVEKNLPPSSSTPGDLYRTLFEFSDDEDDDHQEEGRFSGFGPGGYTPMGHMDHGARTPMAFGPGGGMTPLGASGSGGGRTPGGWGGLGWGSFGRGRTPGISTTSVPSSGPFTLPSTSRGAASSSSASAGPFTLPSTSRGAAAPSNASAGPSRAPLATGAASSAGPPAAASTTGAASTASAGPSAAASISGAAAASTLSATANGTTSATIADPTPSTTASNGPPTVASAPSPPAAAPAVAPLPASSANTITVKAEPGLERTDGEGGGGAGAMNAHEGGATQSLDDGRGGRSSSSGAGSSSSTSGGTTVSTTTNARSSCASLDGSTSSLGGGSSSSRGADGAATSTANGIGTGSGNSTSVTDGIGTGSGSNGNGIILTVKTEEAGA